MPNDLVSPADLTDFPGAPFPDVIVDGAVGGVRGDAGWHIAPEVTETLTVDGSPTTVLILPTLLLTAVTEVRDVTGDAPVVITGWRKSKRGLLYRMSGWPQGPDAVEVDVTHGYAETPPELLGVVAEYCQASRTNASVRSETAGGESISYSAGSPVGPLTTAVLDRFTVDAGF